MERASVQQQDRLRRRAERRWTAGEEVAHSITHGLGALLAVVGTVALVGNALLVGDLWRVIGAAVFGSTLALLYSASTLYHSLPAGRFKQIAKTIDHAAIYLLIAGSYTPLTLVVLRGGWGWSLFAFAWGMAIGGIILEAVWVYRPRWLSTVLYLLMGWGAAVAINPLLEKLSPQAVAWMVAGGLAYTLGVIFYALNHVRYMHAVWHLWVLGGSACHFVLVFFYVVPVR